MPYIHIHSEVFEQWWEHGCRIKHPPAQNIIRNKAKVAEIASCSFVLEVTFWARILILRIGNTHLAGTVAVGLCALLIYMTVSKYFFHRFVNVKLFATVFATVCYGMLRYVTENTSHINIEVIFKRGVF